MINELGADFWSRGDVTEGDDFEEGLAVALWSGKKVASIDGEGDKMEFDDF